MGQGDIQLAIHDHELIVQVGRKREEEVFAVIVDIVARRALLVADLGGALFRVAGWRND